METIKTENLTLKTGNAGCGVNAFIKAALVALPQGEAIAMADLVKVILAEFPTVGTKQRAYIRINGQYQKLVKKDVELKKFVNESNGYTYIGR